MRKKIYTLVLVEKPLYEKWRDEWIEDLQKTKLINKPTIQKIIELAYNDKRPVVAFAENIETLVNLKDRFCSSLKQAVRIY